MYKLFYMVATALCLIPKFDFKYAVTVKTLIKTKDGHKIIISNGFSYHIM